MPDLTDQMSKEWAKAMTAFLTAPPNAPNLKELWDKAHEIDAKCRAAGVLPVAR